jgi:hypothetical protein
MIAKPTVEILERTAATPADRFRVMATSHPFSCERREMHLPEGGTISDIVAAAGIPKGCWPRVTINGDPVKEEWWPRVRPRKGSVVTIQAVPQGGGGGQGQDRNKTLRTVLQIVIIIVAIAVTWYIGGWGGVAAGAAISLGGNIAIGFLLPPSFAKPKGRDNRDGLVSSITGARNTANKGGVIPKVIGRHRLLPSDLQQDEIVELTDEAPRVWSARPEPAVPIVARTETLAA